MNLYTAPELSTCIESAPGRDENESKADLHLAARHGPPNKALKPTVPLAYGVHGASWWASPSMAESLGVVKGVYVSKPYANPLPAVRKPSAVLVPGDH